MPKLPNLRAVREAALYSQAELAALSGVAQPTISHLETGRAAQFVTVKRLAEALRVDPRELMDAR